MLSLNTDALKRPNSANAEQSKQKRQFVSFLFCFKLDHGHTALVSRNSYLTHSRGLSSMSALVNPV